MLANGLNLDSRPQNLAACLLSFSSFRGILCCQLPGAKKYYSSRFGAAFCSYYNITKSSVLGVTNPLLFYFLLIRYTLFYYFFKLLSFSLHFFHLFGKQNMTSKHFRSFYTTRLAIIYIFNHEYSDILTISSWIQQRLTYTEYGSYRNEWKGKNCQCILIRLLIAFSSLIKTMGKCNTVWDFPRLLTKCTKKWHWIIATFTGA